MEITPPGGTKCDIHFLYRYYRYKIADIGSVAGRPETLQNFHGYRLGGGTSYRCSHPMVMPCWTALISMGLGAYRAQARIETNPQLLNPSKLIHQARSNFYFPSLMNNYVFLKVFS